MDDFFSLAFCSWEDFHGSIGFHLMLFASWFSCKRACFIASGPANFDTLSPCSNRGNVFYGRVVLSARRPEPEDDDGSGIYVRTVYVARIKGGCRFGWQPDLHLDGFCASRRSLNSVPVTCWLHYFRVQPKTTFNTANVTLFKITSVAVITYFVRNKLCFRNTCFASFLPVKTIRNFMFLFPH